MLTSGICKWERAGQNTRSEQVDCQAPRTTAARSRARIRGPGREGHCSVGQVEYLQQSLFNWRLDLPVCGMCFVWFQLLHMILDHNRGDTLWWCRRLGVSALLHSRCRHFALDPSQRRPPACAHTSTIRQDLHRGAEIGQHTVSERQQQADRTPATRRWQPRETHPPCVSPTRGAQLELPAAARPPAQTSPIDTNLACASSLSCRS